jgi:hypothetical protein
MSGGVKTPIYALMVKWRRVVDTLSLGLSQNREIHPTQFQYYK